LTKKDIRTQYAGFVLFFAKLLTVATGIIFTLMVARSVSQADYGIWGKINTVIIPYFTLLAGAIPFWVTRFVARDREGAVKTGIFANVVIAAIATLAYVILMPFLVPWFGLENFIMLYAIAGVQIIEAYLIAVLEGCIQAQRPHLVGYGLFISEVCKVLLASVFIIGLQLSLLGAILSILAAFAIKIAIYLKVMFKELRNRMELSYIIEWIKGSSFNIFNLTGNIIAGTIFAMLAIYGGDIGTSYYLAALQIANIITYSSFLAFALYPKLLAESKMEDTTACLKMVLMFAIPMTAGVMAIPAAFLVILQDIYGAAAPVLIILAIDSLILTISSILTSVLYGIEKVDEKAKIPFGKVARSRLFIIFSLPYVHSLITLPTAYYALTNLTNSDPLLVAIYATAINTAAHFAMLIVLCAIIRKAVVLEIPWISIAKYIFASISMAAFLIVINPTRVIITLAVTAAGGIIYLALILAIDKETRALASAVLQEIKSKRH